MSPTVRSLEHPILWVAVILGTLGAIVLLNTIAWLTLPLVLAVVFYYLVEPLLQRMVLAGATPNQALGIFLGVATLLTALAAVTILPAMLNGLSEFQAHLPEYWDRLQAVIQNNLLLLEGKFHFAKKAKLAEAFQSQIDRFASTSGKEYIADTALFLLHWLPSLLLVPFLAFFFLLS